MSLESKKYIFVVGGVMSGVGKGITTSSIAMLLKYRGFKVTAIKMDPYINVDAGTMNPTEHGEVFVLDDGDETDQDMGNYERFLNTDLSSLNYMTTGRVYQSVIDKERNLYYKGKCVEVVPHIPLEIIERIHKASEKENADITVVEIGGTVGEYQNILFLEAARMMKIKNPDDVLFVLVSYIPIPNKVGEMKTKPTQYASRTLNSAGIQADIIIARSEKELDDIRKDKIALSCSVNKNSVISAPDVDSIYHVPLNFEKYNLSSVVLDKLKLNFSEINLSDWKNFTDKIDNTKESLKIGIVGKYFSSGNFVLSDAYISVIEALKHASFSQNIKVDIEWLDSEEYEKNPNKLEDLSNFGGIVVPGGFGSRGIEGKINVARYCRENKIPYFGLCYGMQIAVIEYARNVLKLEDVNTVEINPDAKNKIVDMMDDQISKIKNEEFGGTMRLGSYETILELDTIAYSCYKASRINERHRHRYEVNPKYVKDLEDAGLVFSGKSPSGKLMEILELPKYKHPFFLATQFHPEFKSKPLNPHPLFIKFIEVSFNNLDK